MKKLLYLALFIPLISFAQRDFLNEGNRLLSENKNKEAEEVFKEALKLEKNNVIYRNQLALALLNQGDYSKAENQLEKILSENPKDVAALWYSGINNFQNSIDFRKAIEYFERAFPLISKTSSQFFAVNFFIGKCYRNLLYTEGIGYDETSRMLETLKEYVKLQPNAEDTDQWVSFIKYVEENRMPRNVGRWIITNEQIVDDFIKKEVGRK